MQIEVAVAQVSPYSKILFQIFLYIAENGSSAGVRELQGFLTSLERRQSFRSGRVAEAAEEVVGAFQHFWSLYRAGQIDFSDRAIGEALVEMRKNLSAVEAALVNPDILMVARKTAKSAAAQENLVRLRHLLYPEKSKDRVSQVISIFGNKRTVSAALSSSGVESASGVDNAWSMGKLDVSCLAVYSESHDVKTFVFSPQTPGLICRFKAGQFVTLEVAIDGDIFRRSYTISSSPSRPFSFAITVKRNPGGKVSNWLHENLKIGAKITVSGPYGKFNIEDIPSTKQLFISGGSGITPVISMTRWLFDMGQLQDCVFIHCARSPEDLLFYGELCEMAKKVSGLRVAYICSEDAGLAGWTGYRGRISTKMIEMIVPDFGDRTVYTCGPAPFMSAVKDSLTSGGFPISNYHQESFGPAISKAPLASGSASTERDPEFGQPKSEKEASLKMPSEVLSDRKEGVASKSNELSRKFEVTFKKNGKTVDAGAGETILEAAERGGIEIPNSCRAGACGCCKLKKSSGEVSMNDCGGLTDQEKAAGYILPCVCQAKSKIELDF